MPGFDTTDVAAQVQAPQVNPIQTIEGLAFAQNALNQNKMFQAQARAGQYLTQSLGPNGQPDPGRLGGMLQADPVTAPYAAQIMSNAFGIATQGVGLQQEQTNLAQSYTGNLRQDLAAIPPTGNAAEDQRNRASAVAAGVLSGRYPQQFATSFLGGNPLPDGSTLADSLAEAAKTGALTGAAGPGGMAAQGYVEPSSVATGGGTRFVRANPVTGTVTPAAGGAAFVPNVQSPEAMGQLVSYQGPDGAMHQIPKSAIQTLSGAPIPNVKDANGYQITDASGSLATTLAPESAAMLNTTATNEADRATALQTAFEGSKNRQALLSELMQTGGDFKSGPGAAKWSSIVTEANRILGTNFANDQASAEQVYGKIVQQLSSQQRDTLGLPATDAGQRGAELASPNTAYSPQANQAVAAQLAGNEDLIQKKTAAWDKYQKAGGSYNGFVKQFNSVYDPRYFWDKYAPPERQATVGMAPAEAAAYQARKQRALGLNF